MQTDEQLAKEAVAGSRPALEELWRRHRRLAGAVLLAHAPRGADLEDLLQDVALDLTRGISTLRAAESFRAWLRVLALNVARGAGRRQSRRGRSVVVGDLDALADPTAADGAVVAEQRAGARHVLQLAQRLPLDYREPLLLQSVEGLSQREIAAAMDLPETTIETRIARARRMLREQMAREEATEGRRSVQKERP